MSQPHFGLSVRMRLILPKVGTWSPSGLPKTQSLIAEVKTPSIEVFFISLEKVLKCRCPKWPRMNDLDIFSLSYEQKKGQFDSWPLKVGNRPDPDVYKRSATWRWKALEESYKIALDLVPIRGLSKKLWMPKVPRVQPKIISGLLFGSLEKKVLFRCSTRGELQRILYGGRWWLSLSPGRGESSESKVVRG
jgi:hypothetical protein